MPYHPLNWIRKSISQYLFILVLGAYACSRADVIEEKPAGPPESPQLNFIRSLRSKNLIGPPSDSSLMRVIATLCAKTRFAGKFTINSSVDKTALNFFILDAAADTSLRNICAYIGDNIILLDRNFLHHYFDTNTYFSSVGATDLDSMYSLFQYWVIGHEIAHAELGHAVGHFVSYIKPRNSEEGFQFHKQEIDADERSAAYFGRIDVHLMESMFLRLFQSDYDAVYGPEPSSPNKYLKYYDEFGLQRPYSFRGIGSHPLMMYRSALLLLLKSNNEVIKNEAYTFLVKINAFANVRKWKPEERRDIKIRAFHKDD